MTIFINGEPVDADNARTIGDLIRNHQLREETTLVECNGIALHRRDWATRMLQATTWWSLDPASWAVP